MSTSLSTQVLTKIKLGTKLKQYSVAAHMHSKKLDEKAKDKHKMPSPNALNLQLNHPALTNQLPDKQALRSALDAISMVRGHLEVKMPRLPSLLLAQLPSLFSPTCARPLEFAKTEYLESKLFLQALPMPGHLGSTPYSSSVCHPVF